MNVIYTIMYFHIVSNLIDLFRFHFFFFKTVKPDYLDSRLLKRLLGCFQSLSIFLFDGFPTVSKEISLKQSTQIAYIVKYVNSSFSPVDEFHDKYLY